MVRSIQQVLALGRHGDRNVVGRVQESAVGLVLGLLGELFHFGQQLVKVLRHDAILHEHDDFGQRTLSRAVLVENHDELLNLARESLVASELGHMLVR